MENTTADTSKTEKSSKRVRLVKPNKSDLDTAIESIQREIAEHETKSKEVKSQIDRIINERSGSRGEFDEAQNLMKQYIAEKKQVQAEKNTLSAARDAARDKIVARQNAEKAARADLKFNSAEAIDKQIRELEQRQARTTMSLNDEKKIIKDIKALQLSKKALVAVADMITEIESAKLAKEEVDKAYGQKLTEMKNVNDRINAQKEILDRLNKNNTSNKDAIPGLRKQQNDLRAIINESYTKMKTLRTNFKVATDQYFALVQEERAKQKEIKQKEFEARKAAEEELQKQLEAEELARVPYEEEMQLCASLIQYLESNFVDKAAEAEEVSTATKSLEVEGMVLFTRDDNDFLKVGDAKKRGKKKGKNARRDVIVHGVDTIKSFSLLQITPPSSAATVTEAIEALKQKKIYFQGLERGAVPSIAAAARAEREAQAAQGSTKKSSRNGFSLEQDFPNLAITESVQSL